MSSYFQMINNSRLFYCMSYSIALAILLHQYHQNIPLHKNVTGKSTCTGNTKLKDPCTQLFTSLFSNCNHSYPPNQQSKQIKNTDYSKKNLRVYCSITQKQEDPFSCCSTSDDPSFYFLAKHTPYFGDILTSSPNIVVSVATVLGSREGLRGETLKALQSQGTVT